jgi:hypothetical protein
VRNPRVFAKGAKGANFYTSGFGTLAGQKLVSKGAKDATFSGLGIGGLLSKTRHKAANHD